MPKLFLTKMSWQFINIDLPYLTSCNHVITNTLRHSHLVYYSSAGIIQEVAVVIAGIASNTAQYYTFYTASGIVQ